MQGPRLDPGRAHTRMGAPPPRAMTRRRLPTRKERPEVFSGGRGMKHRSGRTRGRGRRYSARHPSTEGGRCRSPRRGTPVAPRSPASPARWMLVQVLAGAHAQDEAPGHHPRARRGGLGDNGRVHAEARAHHRGADGQPARGVRDAADHAPHERTLVLLVDPSALGQPGEPDEVIGTEFLARALVANVDDAPPERQATRQRRALARSLRSCRS